MSDDFKEFDFFIDNLVVFAWTFVREIANIQQGIGESYPPYCPQCYH